MEEIKGVRSEGVLHTKLDRLLTETLSEAVRLRIARPGEQVNDRLVFRTVFRLLAAKVLEDREHAIANTWDASDIDSVLAGISGYYTLPKLPGESSSFKNTVFEEAWTRLRGAINFQNISSDILAFVYENTLVTPETREHFGTHSTPRAVAEYIVRRLNFTAEDARSAKVYEPFAGAGVFMVAALSRFRDLLPVEMTAAERHHVLVDRIAGDEIDPFATEVATLSLILADYPNENGWAVRPVDLFKHYAVARRAAGATVVLCNPPFEAFKPEERLRYPEAAQRSPYKPIAALEGVLDAQPAAIGFVLPEPFIHGQQYAPQRRRVEQLYRNIELVSLPDRIFKASVIRSSLVIAQEPRANGITSLRSTVVSAWDRARFLKTGAVSRTRERLRPMGRMPGDLWVEELEEIWEYLAGLSALQTVADVHNGLQWKGGQARAVRQRKEEGFCPGIHEANAVRTFDLGRPVYVNCQAESFRRSAAYDWGSPKILANAARLSRGPGCFAATVDRAGLLASQQLFGIWLKPHERGVSLDALCAILNSPLAVAYLASHSPPDRIRVGTVEDVPLPSKLPSGIDALVEQYTSLLNRESALVSPDFVDRAARALNAIDAAVLAAYDLPPRLERQLLEYFRGDRRPTVHDWSHWIPADFQAYMPLHRYLSKEFEIARSGWVLNVFKPLPEDEAAALREALE
jgi:hypothetical protein